MVLAGVCALFLACGQAGGGSGGPSSGGGVGGTGVTTGPITAFGSIFVNEIEWFIDNSEIEFDEQMGSEDDLRIGMVVRVEGEIDREAGTGQAQRVYFDDELEGPIERITDVGLDGLIKELLILGRTVQIQAGVTQFDDDEGDDEEDSDSDFGFDTIAVGDVVEVSGLIDQNGTIRATHIELEGEIKFGVTEVELKGIIEGFVDGSSEFMIGAVTVHFDPTGENTDLSDLPGGVRNGEFVEVEGTITAVNEVDASEIELEDEFDDDDEDGDEFSITGFVQDYMGIDDFFVGSQAVDASDAEFENGNASMLEAGVLVEVEGEILDGVLIAEEVEFESDVEISAAIASDDDIDPETGRVFVLGIEVKVSPSTKLEDSLSGVEPFGLDNLKAGDFLKIKGIAQGSGIVLAEEIKRDEVDDIELRGPVDSFDSVTGEIVILGVSVAANVSTVYEINEMSVEPGEFFDQLETGDRVEIEDKHEGDGDASAIDFADRVKAQED
jgi:hypothetical protein